MTNERTADIACIQTPYTTTRSTRPGSTAVQHGLSRATAAAAAASVIAYVCIQCSQQQVTASVRVTWRTPGVHLCVTRQPGQHTTPLPYTVRLTLRSIRHVFNTHSHRSCTSPNTLNHVRSSVCLSLRTSDVCRSACTTEGGGAAGAVPPALDVLGSTVVVYYAV